MIRDKKQLFVHLPYSKEDALQVKGDMDFFLEQVNNMSSVVVRAGGLYEAMINPEKTDDGSYILSIHGKHDIAVPAENLPEVQEGVNSIPVYVKRVAGELTVDLKTARDMVMWKRFQQFQADEAIVMCQIQQVVHCGYMVRINRNCQSRSQDEVLQSLEGVKVENNDFESTNTEDYVNAFLPHSHCINTVKVGDEIYVSFLKIDLQKKNIIVSSKKVIFNVKKVHQKQLFDLAEEALKKGDKIIADVVVTNVVEFGVFAKVMSVIIKDKDQNVLASVSNLNGCIDGLLHVSEISWKKDNKLTTMKYSTGDKIQVVITEIDREKNRVHFSLKLLQSNPWEMIEKKFKIGQIYKECTVSGVLDDNLLISIPGVEIEGLVQAKEISWNAEECDVYKQFVVGMKVNVMVICIDIEKEKLFLSIKKVENMSNLIDLKKKFEANDNIVRAQVKSIEYNYLLVELEQGLVGKVLKEYLHWDISKRDLQRYKVGDEIKCKIIVFNEYTEEIHLGIKQLEADPSAAEYDKLVVGNKYKCIVSSVQYSNIMVKVNGKSIDGSIHYSNFSKNKSNCLTSGFKVGQEIEARILEINKDIGIVKLTLLEEEE